MGRVPLQLVLWHAPSRASISHDWSHVVRHARIPCFHKYALILLNLSSVLTRAIKKHATHASRGTTWIHIPGRLTTHVRAALKYSRIVTTTWKLRRNCSKSPVDSMVAAGLLVFEANPLTRVRYPYLDELRVVTLVVARPSRNSLIFYAGMEGVGGIEMDTAADADVSGITRRVSII
jgi:hypothetical protein